MKTSHTPGPWHVAESPNHHSPFITNATGKGTIANSVHGATSAEQEANARLIAAAPELLEALQATRDAIQAVLDIPAHEPASVVLLIRRLMEAKGKANDAIRNTVGE